MADVATLPGLEADRSMTFDWPASRAPDEATDEAVAVLEWLADDLDRATVNEAKAALAA